MGKLPLETALLKIYIIDHIRFINHKELYNCKKNVIQNIERIIFFFIVLLLR